MSLRLETPPEPDVQEPPSIAERRGLIERIAASEQFRRSARLRSFLLYVGQQSLKEGCPEIHEQDIGAKVFGRSPAYDRSQDNIVRVNATELRKRIGIYFESEGAHEPLLLEIPRGAYMPIFRWRNADAGDRPAFPAISSHTPAPAELHNPIEPLPRSEGRWKSFALAVLSGLLAIACIVLFQQSRTAARELYPWADKSTLALFWTDFLHSHADTDIVLPDASLSLSAELLGQTVPLGDYLNHRYISAAGAASMSSERRADLSEVFNHNLVALGDFHAAQQFLALAPRSSSIHLESSRFFTADSLKRDNVILIGGKKADPWVDLLDDGINFSVEFDPTRRSCFIQNRHPTTGEQSRYMPFVDGNAFTGFSVVSYMPNPSRTGKVIVLAGSDSDATGAAAEFLTSEESMTRFRNLIHAQKQLPYFEILLKTSRLNGTSFSAEPLAYRLYP